MLDLHRLRIFRTVVTAGSIQAAATSLGYTPPAISQHIAALQRETGLVLFERVGRGIQPTPDALVLAEEADAVLARLGEAEQVVDQLRSRANSTLSLAYFMSAGTSWLPSLLTQVALRHPDVEITLADLDALPARVEDSFDVQLAVLPESFTARQGLTAIHLLTEPFVAIVPNTHPLAGRSSVKLAELATAQWIDSDSDHGTCWNLMMSACARAGFEPQFRISVDDHRIAMACVAAGQGVTLVPQLAATDLPVGTTVLPLRDPTPERAIFAVVRNEALLSPVVTTTINELRNMTGIAARRAPATVQQSVA